MGAENGKCHMISQGKQVWKTEFLNVSIQKHFYPNNPNTTPKNHQKSSTKTHTSIKIKLEWGINMSCSDLDLGLRDPHVHRF